jgi:hypothetical protein
VPSNGLIGDLHDQKGHNRAAAEWAVFRLIEAGCFKAFAIPVGPKATEHLPYMLVYPGNLCLRPTSGLWELWRDGKQARAKAGEGGKPKRTKKPLEKSNPMKANVYNRIITEHKSGKKSAAILTALKDDRDFKELVNEAGLNLNPKLVHAALAWGNDPKRKNQESPPV